jgi:hypothetical protein
VRVCYATVLDVDVQVDAACAFSGCWWWCWTLSPSSVTRRICWRPSDDMEGRRQLEKVKSQCGVNKNVNEAKRTYMSTHGTKQRLGGF